MAANIKAVAAIIREGDHFLLGKRAPHKRSAPGFWSPISGRMEEGESEQQALVREVQEEVGLHIKPVRKMGHLITPTQTVINCWLVEIIAGEARLNDDENSEIRWVTVAEMEEMETFFPEYIEWFKEILAGVA